LAVECDREVKGLRRGLVSLPFAETVSFFVRLVQRKDVVRGPSPISTNKGGLASSFKELSMWLCSATDTNQHLKL
jgi:hypothetical protein